MLLIKVLVASALSTLIVLGMAPSAPAAPTCPDPQTRAVCGDRVIAHPAGSTSFIQYGTEYEPAIRAIEAIAPQVIAVKPIGAWIGRPKAASAGGLDIYVVRLTDESASGPKRQVAISLSVHGNESAGREGGLRYIEDIAHWWTQNDRDRVLYAGDKGVPLADVMKATEVYICICNVDGWAAGDLPKPAFTRGNANRADLNRDYPTIGWTKQDQLQQPETKAWVRLVESLPNLTTATDIHGELTSATDSFSDIMFPAGQWDPVRQAQELQFAQDMVRTVERKFVEEGVTAETLLQATGDERVIKPASFATAYDIIGYDDSGFMGDWFVSQGAVELDVEN
ncbi:MAG: M14 family zinc carboxypeptidase, partial [Actinomycetota bacterium]